MRRVHVAASLALALLTAACSTRWPVPAAGDSVVYVVHRGWHTDIALPAATLGPDLAPLVQGIPDVRTLSFGFGERQFLLTRDSTIGTMLRALLPSASALLVTFLNASPQQAFGAENVVALHVTQANLNGIQNAIRRELDLTAAHQPVRLANGPYPGSTFYAARDTYHAFYTCNAWTADTLRAGGLRMPAGLLFAGQVMTMARWMAAQQRTLSPPRIPSLAAGGQ